MSIWPKLSNIDSRILGGTFNKKSSLTTNERTSWIRVFSGAETGAGSGLILSSTQDFGVFKAAGQSKGTVYGDFGSSGDMGVNWNLKRVPTPGSVALRPSPIVTGLEIKEGKDQISREGVLKLKCFTLEQMELIQTYFLEPGYTLCIEYGWNSTAGAAAMIDIGQKQNGILTQATERNLNYQVLENYRFNSNGDYDTFLAFIVGGTVSSDGDKWNIDVKLRGAPALPTYLQTQNKTLAMEADGSVIPKVSEPLTYLISDTEKPSGDGDGGVTARDRRFKNMFNALPAQRQIADVQKLIDSCIMEDFINFDAIVTNQLITYVNPDSEKKETVKVNDNVTIEKERIYSKNRYIRMDLAVKILNANGNLGAYLMGNKKVTVHFDIDDSKIGAFPYMFSTKASKLLIPNKMPDFTMYFLAASDITQGKGGFLNTTAPIDNGITGRYIFSEPKELKSDGYNEKAEYWGYLKNLYINFDVFTEKIQQKNKNIREVFIDMLNELSAGANSFWNFQIVEKEITKDDKVKGYKKGDIVLTVIDENWIGSNKQPSPYEFHHSGPYSVFLDANIDISVPSEMTNQIISRRLSLINNPDEPIVGVGGFFNSKNDLFLNNYTDASGKPKKKMTEAEKAKSEADEAAKLAEEKKPESKKIEETIAKSETAIGVNKTSIDTKEKELDALKAALDKVDGNESPFFDDEKLNATEKARLDKLIKDKKAEIATLEKANDEEEKKVSDGEDKLDDQKDKELEDAKKEEQAKVTNNLSKIDILVQPRITSMGELHDDALTDLSVFKGYFAIYCFDDVPYFDLLKNDAFHSKKGNEAGTTLSHPLPIKYNFKILGNSGIRRGDMFNVIGIPAKYREHGLFQVTQIEQNLEGPLWTTQITGEYRQKQ